MEPPPPPPIFNPNPDRFNPEPMINFAAEELGLRVEDYAYLESGPPQPQLHPSQETNSSDVRSISVTGASSASTGTKRWRTSWVWVEGHFGTIV
jgi:hypothetical protein